MTTIGAQEERRGGAMSLLELSKRQCLRFYNLLEDVGDARYDLVEPILRKVTARQLILIERNCPQVKSRSSELWKYFIKRDFADRPVPDGYYKKTYVKYFKEKEIQLEDASIRLRESMNKFKKEKEARTITSLEVDPQSERARKRRIMSSGPAGSKLIQKAYQQAKTKGPMFSPRNMRFAKTNTSATSSKLPPPAPPSSNERKPAANSKVESTTSPKPPARRPTKPTSSIFLPRRPEHKM